MEAFRETARSTSVGRQQSDHSAQADSDVEGARPEDGIVAGGEFFPEIGVEIADEGGHPDDGVVAAFRLGAVRGPAPDDAHPDISRRGRRNIALDLKHPEGVATLLDVASIAATLPETSTVAVAPAGLSEKFTGVASPKVTVAEVASLSLNPLAVAVTV